MVTSFVDIRPNIAESPIRYRLPPPPAHGSGYGDGDRRRRRRRGLRGRPRRLGPVSGDFDPVVSDDAGLWLDAARTPLTAAPGAPPEVVSAGCGGGGRPETGPRTGVVTRSRLGRVTAAATNRLRR